MSNVSDLTDPTNSSSFPYGWNILDDQLAENQRWSTWTSIEAGMRGPHPRPDYVIEDAGAIDTELGLLKTGKEADVFLIERASTERSTILAAKRYRSPDQRLFHRSTDYTEGRQVRRSRDQRALEKKTTYGKTIAAAQWAWAEWTSLCLLWEKGVPVPYPVQIDGTEILMEFIEDPDTEGAAAPRLQQARPDRERLEEYWHQLVEAMLVLASLGFAHGDLSPYNVLAAGSRLVIIDLPQLVDLAANPHGMEMLERDCRNMCTWFNARGLKVDDGELFAELVAAAW
ncbi:serine protein kinase RIO [Arthrobacter roseus]|uniref:serine protein kinase RIO n=1 Tax=Arthrobacter roseus TaxID=136274 RepID=UPI001966A65B|nr:RIO1 family regulatory kinase/ATPase [Arthrobacter roseus]MBM7849497.1 RIO kinase 1 [Arthrobacter roseus]